jgi:hypothetical protein
MTTTINITWHQPDERSIGREDSAWYSHSADHHDIIATVSNGERSIHICADGEVRVHLAYNPADWSQGHHVIRYCDQWGQYEIKNDNDIFEMAEEGLIEWVNNSWFDLYAEKRGWSDCVNHTLTDAIASATELLTDPEAWDD